ncbi:MAG: hypothetical protein EP318_15395 [Rhodobacteraceae bacterium]|nr:MAG: hypothetical protein EP318_15395 [Paracoccaceae bacterium]
MSVLVYPFPPVGFKGWEWTTDYPVQSSRSGISGAAYLSEAGRARRMVTLDVSGTGTGNRGAGYVEALKALLKGRNCVRLYSCGIFATEDRQSTRLLWSAGDVDLNWTASGTDMRWYDGRVIYGTTGTDSDGYNIVTLSNAPPSVTVANPGEFLTIFADADDTTGETIMILNHAVSDENGDAVVRVLDDSLSSHINARVNLGTRDTGVFRALEMPRSVRPIEGDFSYVWNFEEVFADEVGGFTELPSPWGTP